jgi:D-glycero-D-manno-heptose 1,7-bisphosphate phosphatase
MAKAVFLDRDGVIVTERGSYNFLPEHLEFTDGIVESLTDFINKGYLLIIISNQGGIAQGLYTSQQADTFNKAIIDYLNNNGIPITDTFYCPHYPDKTKCICRKPGTQLLEKAMHLYDINPGLSFFIGDQARDAEAATFAGIKPILIESNSSLLPYIHLF